MKRQATSYWCGVASVASAMEVLGIRRSQREIARVCDVRPEAGTNEEEMIRALLANKLVVDEWIGDEPADSAAWLRDHLRLCGPVILCVDESDHWVTVIGLCRSRFILWDPSRNEGVEVHTEDSLAVRWRDSEDGFYGLGVSLG